VQYHVTVNGHRIRFCYLYMAYNMPEGGPMMQCPVCAREAQNLTPNTLDGVMVGCERCGAYRVAGGAYYELMQLDLKARFAALETAKVAARYGWPLIDGSCVRAR
jgi:hypothetical protein